MGFYVNCESSVKNTGVGGLCQDLGAFSNAILTPLNWEKSETDIRLEATFITAIHAEKGERIYPLLPLLQMTNNSEETIYQELALGRLFVKNGKTILYFEMDSSRYKHEALKSHSLRKYGIVLIDQQNRLHGVKDGANFKSVPLQEFVVEKIKLNDGAGEAVRTGISLVFANPEEFERSPAVVSGLTFEVGALEGLKDINIEVISSSAAGVVFKCLGDKTGKIFTPAPPTADPTTDGDVVIKTSLGAEVTLTSVTTAGDGTTTAACTLTPEATYTIDFYPPATMVTKGYECVEAISFTVPVA
jgi:hypothetical protein